MGSNNSQPVQPAITKLQQIPTQNTAYTRPVNQIAKNNLNNQQIELNKQQKMYQLPVHKQSRQEIYQNRPRVLTMQTCSGCSSNINTSNRIIQQNTNHINQSKLQCNAALHVCPYNSVKHVNNCISSNLDCNCNSKIYINNRCNCTSCNGDQNNSICISRNNATCHCNSSKTCCSAHMDSSCLNENKIKSHQQHQDDCNQNIVVQNDTCNCGNCVQVFDTNYAPKYAEYFNQNNENNYQTHTLMCDENQLTVENNCSSNYNNTNETSPFYSIPNVPTYASNENSHIISQQSNMPLNQSLVYLPPPTNLGTNQYPVLDQTGINFFPNQNDDSVIRNLVDLPDQKARNVYLKGSKNKFRKEKNYTTNPITRETIQKLYDISQYEVNKLKKIFDAYSGVDRKLNFQEYIRLYGYMNQNLRGPKVIQIAEHAFHQGDVDNDGLINFDQFLITYALTKPYGAYNRSKLNSEQIQGQGYSKINNSYLPTSNLNENSLRIFNNNLPLAIEYNQESDVNKKSSYENFKNKQTYSNQMQQNQVLSPLINSMSDQNLYSKNY